MSQILTALNDLASVGSPITCTLSPETVQVIFFAVSFLENMEVWKEDYFDQITSAEEQQIRELIEGVSQDIIP